MTKSLSIWPAHGRASAQPRFFDQQTEDIRVLLMDVPLTSEGLEAA